MKFITGTGDETLSVTQNQPLSLFGKGGFVKTIEGRSQANAMLSPSQKIVPHNVGCSDKSFSQSIRYSAENFGAASLETDQSAKDTHTAIFQLVRLDDYLSTEEQSSVGFMKLDVEGHETMALRGAEEIIARSKPIIAFEAYNIDEPKEYLNGLGYNNFYGFEKTKPKWHVKSEIRLAEITDRNKNNIDVHMAIASYLKLNKIMGRRLK